MRRMSTMMIAITNKICINPPIVVEVMSPNNQSMTSIAAIVSNIVLLYHYTLTKVRRGLDANSNAIRINMVSDKSGDLPMLAFISSLGITYCLPS